MALEDALMLDELFAEEEVSPEEQALLEEDPAALMESLEPAEPAPPIFPPVEDPVVRDALAALYGDTFPPLMSEYEDEDWVKWAKQLWEQHQPGIQHRLHLVERNRLFRRGIQWISSRGGGPWREPPKPRDAARVVQNMIAPALDMRLQIVMENRPGFRARPASRDVDDVKKAEASQVALEYQFDQQNMRAAMREAKYWAGTDGVAFIQPYWDPDRGPWHEYSDGQKRPMGDIAPCVHRLEQVRVSAEASATKRPWYVVIREALPLSRAVKDYGLELAEDVSLEVEEDILGDNYGLSRLGYMYPEIEELYRDQKLVERLTVFCEPTEYTTKGLMLVAVGGKLIYVDELPYGCVPLIRVPDGSSDPAYFPTPIMDLWLDPQMRINATLSKWVENVRLNAGPRLLAKQHALVGETLMGGTMSVWEVKGLGALNDIIRPVEGFSLANDTKEMLDRDIKFFEDISGWNEVSRGQFSSEQSGRAILAIREQLERVFAPDVNATAEAMTEWAKITLKIMRWGYDLPRTLSAMGKSRPDLAREFTGEDFDGVTDVFVDPETMMPMPRALKLFLLDNLFEKGAMPPQEYRRRYPFAITEGLGTPDEDQEARARRVVEMMRNGEMPPILWVDNEAIHQDVLERELILPDDTDPMLRQMAMQRWMMLAQQAQMKMMGMAGGPMQGQQPAPQGGGGSSQSSPQQPLQGTNPSIAAPPEAGGLTDEERRVRLFEGTQPQ